MLKLKSIVKTREQLLATGWVEDRSVGFSNAEVHRGHLHVKPEMLGRPYNGVVKDFTHKCTLEGVGDIWTLCPEMMLVTDQWGFVRDLETLDILMWDAARYNKAIFVDIISTLKEDFPIMGLIGDLDICYTKDGKYDQGMPPTLSKYPYSLTHGGYTPFGFEELKHASTCPKVVEGSDDTLTTPSDSGNSTKPDSCRSAMMSESKGHVEITTEAKMKDEAKPPVTLGDQEMHRIHFVSTTIRQLTESMRYLDGDVKKMVEQKIAELLKSI